MRADVNVFTYQPILNRILGNWYFGLGDIPWAYDWKGGGWIIPLGFQVGRITQIGKHNYNLSCELAHTFIQDPDVVAPDWGIKLEFVLLIPE